MNTDNLVLRPNCLLTRYPLVFITGFRSILFSKKLGSDLQDFLLAHGYQVMSPTMPFSNSKLRTEFLKKWLQMQTQKKFHFVMSKNTYEEFKNLLAEYQTSSFTIIGKNYEISEGTLSIKLRYSLHSILGYLRKTPFEPYSYTLNEFNLDFFNRFLDHCVELAENDYI